MELLNYFNPTAGAGRFHQNVTTILHHVESLKTIILTHTAMHQWWWQYGGFPVELHSKINLLNARQDNVGSKFVCRSFRYDFDVCTCRRLL